MADPFIGEIRAFAWGMAPRGWAFCNGALLSIQQNGALFSLLGTHYGGNGTTNFALPDLRGRGMMHRGTGRDGTHYGIGTAAGAETIAVTVPTMPAHTHLVVANADAADKAKPDPGPYYLAQANLPNGTPGPIYADFANPAPLAPGSIASTGGGAAHANMQPFLAINLCIALSGIFPSRG